MAREIYYLVQKISTATVRNTNFAGEVHTHIVGKCDETLFAETGSAFCDKDFLTPYFVRKYGYKRMCDAVRNWVYKNPDVDRPYWESEVKIIRAWVRKDNKVYLEI